MAKETETPADIYRGELKVLEARETILQLRLKHVNQQIVETRAKLEECENSE